MAQFRGFLMDAQRLGSTLNYICIAYPPQANKMLQEAAAKGVQLRIISLLPPL